MMPTPDRKRGILTTADRDYLLGRKNFGKASERNTRQRIRDRTRNGLYDFEFLATELGDKDVAQLTTDEGIVDEQIFGAVEDVIAFLFKLCRYAPDTETYTTADRFCETLQNGIEKGIDSEHEIQDFKFDLQYGLPREERKRIYKKVQEGRDLTLAELREVLNNDYLDDSYRFRPLDTDGLPKNVDVEDILSHDDYGGYQR